MCTSCSELMVIMLLYLCGLTIIANILIYIQLETPELLSQLFTVRSILKCILQPVLRFSASLLRDDLLEHIHPLYHIMVYLATYLRRSRWCSSASYDLRKKKKKSLNIGKH